MEIQNYNLFDNNNQDLVHDNMDIDNLVDAFNHKTTVIWRPKLNFVNDINTIIDELKLYNTLIGLDLYEALVSCGHNLTWDQEYFVTSEDLNWFKNEEGKKYFYSSLNRNNSIKSIEEYRAIIDIHNKLVELFELQLDN